MTRGFRIVVALASCSLATPGLAAQERWSVSEGLVDDLHGVWTIETNGEELTAFAEMFDVNGEKKTYFLTGKRENSELVFELQSVDSAPKCTYKMNGSPQEIGDSLSGVIDCEGATRTWLAQKIPEPVEIDVREQLPPDLPKPKKP